MGHASSMSSARPAAFLSAMSMTTTSASCLSAIPRATVAPTLPAPPTTVTLRFIRCVPPAIGLLRSLGSSLALHIPDDGVREGRRFELRRAFHLAREVVGDLLLR